MPNFIQHYLYLKMPHSGYDYIRTLQKQLRFWEKMIKLLFWRQRLQYSILVLISQYTQGRWDWSRYQFDLPCLFSGCFYHLWLVGFPGRRGGTRRHLSTVSRNHFNRQLLSVRFCLFLLQYLPVQSKLNFCVSEEVLLS